MIWGIGEFNAPAPAPGVTSVPGYATAMRIAHPMPDICHTLPQLRHAAIKPTGNCEQ